MMGKEECNGKSKHDITCVGVMVFPTGPGGLAYDVICITKRMK